MSYIKNRLMKQYRAQREQMDFQLRERESEAVCKAIVRLPEWIGANHVMLYVAIKEEVDTKPFLQTLLHDGSKSIFVPYIVDQEQGIAVSRVTSYDQLAPGMFSIPEPRLQYRKEVDPEQMEIVCVPGIVFDRRGGRIGYGHGYYDRFLKRTNAIKIGLAYELQVLQEIPQSSHDVQMDIIVTASEVIRVP